VAPFFPDDAGIGREFLAEGVILAPSYGTVKRIESNPRQTRIIIYLSIFDTHIQYYPADGIVTKQYTVNTGQNYFANDIGRSAHNNSKVTHFMAGQREFIISQFTGFFARRLVTFAGPLPAKAGVGERLGVILFGSRVELILPTQGLKLAIGPGAKLAGPNTAIGKYSFP